MDNVVEMKRVSYGHIIFHQQSHCLIWSFLGFRFSPSQSDFLWCASPHLSLSPFTDPSCSHSNTLSCWTKQACLVTSTRNRGGGREDTQADDVASEWRKLMVLEGTLKKRNLHGGHNGSVRLWHSNQNGENWASFGEWISQLRWYPLTSLTKTSLKHL